MATSGKTRPKMGGGGNEQESYGKPLRFRFIRSDTLVSGWAPDLKLGRSPMPSQPFLVLITRIVHGRPVLDVSLTPLHRRKSQTGRHSPRRMVGLYWMIGSWAHTTPEFRWN